MKVPVVIKNVGICTVEGKGSINVDACLGKTQIAVDISRDLVGIDKYCLELNTSLKDVKMQTAKKGKGNKTFLTYMQKLGKMVNIITEVYKWQSM